MKRFSLFFLSIIGSIANAQTDVSKYISITPPNVASFEKYGNIPLNYSTGQLSYSIPLLSFPIDEQLTLPLTLVYNNSGLVPDEIPSWVGHGWDLMVGGYITQQIRGTSDLSLIGMRNISTQQRVQKYLLGQMDNTQKYFFTKELLNGSADSQYDIFSFSLPGQSGKFYLNGEDAVFIKYMPYKVEFPTGTGEDVFTITDDKGFRFVFGIFVNSSGSYTDVQSEDPIQISSRTWYLTKIITPYNTEVIFEYQADASYTISQNAFQYSFGATATSSSACSQDGAVSNGIGTSSFVEQMIVKQIKYKGRKIEFGTIARNDLVSQPNYTAKALSSIIETNELNQVTREIKFTYTNDLRLKLDKVDILKKIDKTPAKTYSFEYCKYLAKDFSSIPLITSPQRTHAVDHWGFYNGALSNSPNRVPKADYSALFPWLNSFTGDSDRGSKAEFSQIGMLKKIFYPTGGYTEMEYEANTITYTTLNDVPTFLKVSVDQQYTQIFAKQITCVESDVTGTINITENIPNARLAWSLFSNTQDDFCFIKLKKIGSTDEIYRFGYNSQGSIPISLSVGTYQYQLYSGCVTMDGNTSLNYAGFSIEKGPSGPRTVVIGGNRVSRVKDYDVANGKLMIRRIIYEQPTLWNEPYYITQQKIYALVPPLPSVAYMDCGIRYTLGGTNLVAWNGYHIDYKKVTEYFGEMGENGKNVYTFESQAFIGGSYSSEPFPAVINLSWRSGALKKQEIYEKKNSDYFLKKEISTTYTPLEMPIPLQNNGIRISQIGSSPVENVVDVDAFYKHSLIPVISDRFDRSSSTQVEYFDANQSIKQDVFYYYSSPSFLLNRTNQKNSNGKEVDQYVWYADDYNASVANTNLTELKDKNIVGLPLKTIAAINGKMTAGEIYKRNNNGSIIEKYSFETTSPKTLPAHNPDEYYSLGFNLKYTSIFNSGNTLRQQALTKGIPTCYLWGFDHSYPIAIIKNASYQQVLDVLGQSKIDALNSNNPGTDEQVRQNLELLRTDVRLKKSQVSVFTYNPLVGMTSQTGPDGLTTYYEYDQANRLKRVKDQDGNILKQYEYHYKE